MRALFFAVALGGALTATTAFAQNVRVRGVVESMQEGQVQVKTSQGGMQTLKLAPDYSVTATMKRSMADIKSGDFIGVGARPQKDGTLHAVQIMIFPEAMRGTGEGHRDWAVMPEATMTNATVADTVTAVDGQTLTLKYKDGEKKVVVGPDAAILTIGPAAKSDLKPGVELATTAVKGADGALTTSRVTVGKDGVAPPL